MKKKAYIEPKCKTVEFGEETDVLQAATITGDPDNNEDPDDDDWEPDEQNSKFNVWDF